MEQSTNPSYVLIQEPFPEGLDSSTSSGRQPRTGLIRERAEDLDDGQVMDQLPTAHYFWVVCLRVSFWLRLVVKSIRAWKTADVTNIRRQHPICRGEFAPTVTSTFAVPNTRALVLRSSDFDWQGHCQLPGPHMLRFVLELASAASLGHQSADSRSSKPPRANPHNKSLSVPFHILLVLFL